MKIFSFRNLSFILWLKEVKPALSSSHHRGRVADKSSVYKSAFKLKNDSRYLKLLAPLEKFLSSFHEVNSTLILSFSHDAVGVTASSWTFLLGSSDQSLMGGFTDVSAHSWFCWSVQTQWKPLRFLLKPPAQRSQRTWWRCLKRGGRGGRGDGFCFLQMSGAGDHIMQQHTLARSGDGLQPDRTFPAWAMDPIMGNQCYFGCWGRWAYGIITGLVLIAHRCGPPPPVLKWIQFHYPVKSALAVHGESQQRRRRLSSSNEIPPGAFWYSRIPSNVSTPSTSSRRRQAPVQKQTSINVGIYKRGGHLRPFINQRRTVTTTPNVWQRKEDVKSLIITS